MYRHRYHQHFAAPSSPANAAIELWALRYFWLHVFTVVFMVAWLLLIVAKWLWRNGPGWNPPQGEPEPEQGPPPAKPPAAPPLAAPVRRFNWEADLFLPAKGATAQAAPAVKPTTWEKDLFLPARETPAVPAPARPANRVNLEIDPFAPVVYWFKGPIKRKRK